MNEDLPLDHLEDTPLNSESEAASLAALEAGAAVAPDPATVQQAEIAADNSKAESELIVTVIAGALSARWPVLVYDEKTRTDIAAKLAPVMQKHGLNNDWFAKYGEEIALLSSVVVVGYQSMQLVAEDKKQKAIEAQVNG